MLSITKYKSLITDNEIRENNFSPRYTRDNRESEIRDHATKGIKQQIPKNKLKENMKTLCELRRLTKII